MNKKIMSIVGVIVVLIVAVVVFVTTQHGNKSSNTTGTPVALTTKPTISQLFKNGTTILYYGDKDKIYEVSVVANNKVTTYDMTSENKAESGLPNIYENTHHTDTLNLTLSQADKMTTKELTSKFTHHFKPVDLKIKKYDDGTFGVQNYISEDSDHRMQYMSIGYPINAFKINNHYYAGYSDEIKNGKFVVQVNSSKTAPQMEK